MKVVIVSGPTATGKTDLAVELAKKYGGEVVNFDSLLLYKEVTIGTAKPTPAERQSVPHHMIDVRSIAQPMNAADYAKEALPAVEKLLAEKKIVYLVGGSGFYLQALVKGMYDSPTTPIEISQKSDELYKTEGITPFLKILSENDPESFQRYHENDHYRVRRAVEHWWSNGTKLSEARNAKDINNKVIAGSIHDWQILNLYLDIPKDEHNKIIEVRTKKMLADGLIEEVRGLLQNGFTGEEKPLQSIGYKEVLDFEKGIYKNISECQERIIISTRQLAKSQRTWFNRDATRLTFNPQLERDKIFECVRNQVS